MSTNPLNDESKNNTSDWSPDKLNALFSGLSILADKYLSFKDNEAKHDNVYIEKTARHDRKVVIVLLIFLGVLLLALVWLTFTDKVTGEALLFAVGLTIGYVFALIQRFVFGSQRSVTENSES